MTDPRTEAGRRQHDMEHRTDRSTCTGTSCPVLRYILAIEAEAVNVDEAGLPITRDEHSRDWFEGYAAALADSRPEPL